MEIDALKESSGGNKALRSLTHCHCGTLQEMKTVDISSCVGRGLRGPTLDRRLQAVTGFWGKEYHFIQ